MTYDELVVYAIQNDIDPNDDIEIACRTDDGIGYDVVAISHEKVAGRVVLVLELLESEELR